MNIKKVASTLLIMCVAVQMLLPITVAAQTPTNIDLLHYFFDEDLQRPQPITSINTENGETVRFQYDAQGKRIRKEHQGDVTVYGYDISNNMISERTIDLGIRYTLTSINGQYVYDGFIYDSTAYQYKYDAAGNVEYITSAGNQLICKYLYIGAEAICLEYTNGTWQENASPTFLGNINPIRYQGWYYDVETNCYYVGNGIYYSIPEERYIKNEYTLASSSDNSNSHVTPLSTSSWTWEIYRNAAEDATQCLNSSSYGIPKSQVTLAEWNAGKRWYDGMSINELLARCIYAENYSPDSYDERLGIARVMLNRANYSTGGYGGPTLYGVVTMANQFTTVSKGTYGSSDYAKAREAKTPDDAVWVETTFLGCLMALSHSVSVVGEIVGGWPVGISTQMHFYSLDSVYNSSSFYIQNGSMYQNQNQLIDVAVAGSGILTITSTTTKEALLAPYYGGYRHNLFYSRAQ